MFETDYPSEPARPVLTPRPTRAECDRRVVMELRALVASLEAACIDATPATSSPPYSAQRILAADLARLLETAKRTLTKAEHNARGPSTRASI